MDLYILFIHSSVDGHLGYFHSLAIASNAGMTHSRTRFFVDICYHLPRNEIAGSYGNSRFTILGTTRLFSEGAAPFSISISDI